MRWNRGVRQRYFEQPSSFKFIQNADLETGWLCKAKLVEEKVRSESWEKG